MEERLARSKVILFMKGSPEKPRCRFSRAAVELLRALGVTFDHVDVLEEVEYREAMKAYWPTFPQLWVEGICLGGIDRLRALAERGELLDAVRSSTIRDRVALELLLSR